MLKPIHTSHSEQEDRITLHFLMNSEVLIGRNVPEAVIQFFLGYDSGVGTV